MTCFKENVQKYNFWHLNPRREGGVRGHFCMFSSYESTLYCRTAAFYGTKISRRVKKLLTFEGQPLDSFPIVIYRENLVFLVHIFLYLDVRCWKTCLNGEDQLVSMKLDDFVRKNTKIREILTKLVDNWPLFTKMRFSKNHAGAHFFFKNDARKLKFGPGVPLYCI